MITDEIAGMLNDAIAAWQETAEHLGKISKSLEDIKHGIGVLITQQTGGVPPWHYTDQGHNVVNAPGNLQMDEGEKP